MKLIDIKLFQLVGNLPAANLDTGYIAGGIIAVLILGYLIYSLLNPEKL